MWQKFRALDQRIQIVIGITVVVTLVLAAVYGSPSSRGPTAWASISDEDKAINTVCWSDSVAASADDGNGWVVGENSWTGDQELIREGASGEGFMRCANAANWGSRWPSFCKGVGNRTPPHPCTGSKKLDSDALIPAGL